MKKLEQIMSEILEIPEETIETTSMDTTESWDSFNHLLIISEIEKELKISIPFEKISELKTFENLSITIEGLKNENS